MKDNRFRQKTKFVEGAESFLVKSPWRTIVVISASIFVTEALVMAFYYLFTVEQKRPGKLFGYMLLDSTLLVLLLAPILYFTIFRQLLALYEQRKKAAMLIMAERDAAQSYLDIAGVMLVAVDLNGRVSMINKKGCEMLGAQEQDISGRDWFSFVPPDNFEDMRAVFNDLKAGLSARDNYECPIKSLSGRIRIIRWHTRPIIEDERLAGFLSSGEDITDFKHAMTALEEAETRYRLVHSTAFDGIIIAGEDDRIVEANPSAEELFGYKRGGLVGLQLTEIMPQKYRQKHLKGLKRFLDTGVSHSQGRVLELKGLKQNGDNFFIEVVLGNFIVNGRAYFTGTIRDISVRKRAERERELSQMQIAKSQKMETLGRLAGGIAHDFNNILTAIRGNVELALEDIKGEGGVSRRLDEIKDTIGHASKLTRQLLLFSRGRHVERSPVDLNSAVSETIRMIKRVVGPDVLVVTELDDTLRMINADATNMEQVLLNLAINARDAMPEGGSIIIKTENVTLDEEACRDLEGMSPGPAVCLTVEDNGAGMESDVAERIFETFFTTKDASGGLGYGLSVVKDIVTSHEGAIIVKSAPGAGTIFKIYIPAYLGPILKEDSDVAAREPLRSEGEKILLIENDETVSAISASVLTEKGFFVEHVATIKKAIKAFESMDGGFDLVICDTTHESEYVTRLVEYIRSVRPGMPILLTGSYMDMRAFHAESLERNLKFVQKPYSPGGLLRAVATALEKTRSKQ